MSQQKTAEAYFQEGEALFEQGKFFEANQLFDQTIQLDPKYMQAYRFKARCFSSQGKFDEAIEACKTAIKIDPNFVFIYNNLGMAYNSLRRFEEALETYDKAISIDPNFLFAYNNKGETLSNVGRKEEAIKVYSKAIEINPDEYDAYNGQALAFQELGRHQEALELYEKAVKKFPKNSLALCNQAKLLSKLGRNKEALEVLRKVKEIYKNGFIDVKSNPQHLIFIQYAHEMITDLDNIESQTEEIIQQQDQQNPEGQKLIARVRTLQQKKETITAKLITGMDSQSSDDLSQEVERLKAEFLQIKQESVNMKKDVKQIKLQVEDIKEELDNKLDDFRKKFDGALTKTDFSSEDKAKLKDYFNAFLETFSSTHVTSQVVDSGQIQLDSDSTKATLLSVVASFAPFIGTALFQGITSLANFLASKEIKANARKMKGLANDATELSQIIGGAVYKIVLDKQKQQQILSITNEDLKKISGKLLEKISKFCENIDEQIDEYLYTKMYKTASARLGHNDANKLIELWLVGKIDPYAVQEDMIKHALDTKGESEPLRKPPSQPENTDRSACCNMF